MSSIYAYDINLFLVLSLCLIRNFLKNVMTDRQKSDYIAYLEKKGKEDNKNYMPDPW